MAKTTVKSISEMMRPGLINKGGDCETCGPKSMPAVVTRVATENLAKINKSVKKAAAPPEEEKQAAPVKRNLLSPNKTQSEEGK